MQQADGAYGRAVRRLRKAQGVSQQRLADLAGLDRAYLSRIENGRVNFPTSEDLRGRIATALKMTDQAVLERAGIAKADAERPTPEPTSADELREQARELVEQIHPYKLSEAVRSLYLLDRARLDDFAHLPETPIRLLRE